MPRSPKAKINKLLHPILDWFHQQGWAPHPYQQATWNSYLEGNSGLVYIPTGMGKTYAAFLGPLAEMMIEPPKGLFLLYITPLRAVSRDIELALQRPLDDMALSLTLESRTGDTRSAIRARQRKRLPNILITTPESLSLLLTREDAQEQFQSLQAVIVDEWHELIGSKRGTQVELALSRLKAWTPQLRIWGLSATLSNVEDAARTLAGVNSHPDIIQIDIRRQIEVETLIPPNLDAFPWAGHLGLSMVQPVLDRIDIIHATLIFTNTRLQSERWYQAIIEAKPEWSGLVALHHGSLDKKTRAWVENGIKTGTVKIVICTSSLDLGVDFPQVESVFQVGSPKGISRLIQRAGRAFHRPNQPCHIICVPTHAFELLEFAAARDAILAHAVEPRFPLKKPLDVLMQHLMTCAMGGGFIDTELYNEVCQAVSYANLSWAEFCWTLTLLRDGGNTLGAYPEYHRIGLIEGRYRLTNIRSGRLHRLNIGTITSHATLNVGFLKGRDIGQIEEGFISKLNKGDVFMFGGKALQLVMLDEKKAYVRLSKAKPTQLPNWQGGRMPLSTMLAQFLRQKFQDAKDGKLSQAESNGLRAVLTAQQKYSAIPNTTDVLAEITNTREGHHLFLFPLESRPVHEGLGAVLALRMARIEKATFAITINDYGIGFSITADFPFERVLTRELFNPANLAEDIAESFNMTELARRQFRDIARISGLVVSNYPGHAKSGRQLQVSASLLFDVFRNYDPDNLLLHQARQEVLAQQFEFNRLQIALERLYQSNLLIVKPKRPSPLGFPLLIEKIGARLSNETLRDRIERMKRQWTRMDSK